MDFRDKLFALANGLPVSEEPEQHLASDAPSPMEKFRESMALDHAMGKRPVPGEDYEIPVLEKLLAKRDVRECQPIPMHAGDFAKRFGEPITPRAPGDLAKRFTPATDADEDEEELVESYSHGDVIAVLKGGVVQRTFYRARA
jgi:hypothetical protein